MLLGFAPPDDHAHAPNEWMDLGNYETGIRTIVRMWDELAALDRAELDAALIARTGSTFGPPRAALFGRLSRAQRGATMHPLHHCREDDPA